MRHVPSIVPASSLHIPAIVENMRAEDIEELALLGLTPLYAVENSFEYAKAAWTGLVDGVPVCMFGVSPSDSPLKGRPWMMGTKLLEAHAMIFLRRCRPQVLMMLRLYPFLENFVSVDNKRAIEWLRWLGFSFRESDQAQFIIFFRGAR